MSIVFHIKQLGYRLGRWLMHLNYTKGASAVEHDLRLQVAQLQRELRDLKQREIMQRLKRMWDVS